jgi:hypothetical protein
MKFMYWKHKINAWFVWLIVSMFKHFMVWIVFTNDREFRGVYCFNPEDVPHVRKLIDEKNCNILYVHVQFK